MTCDKTSYTELVDTISGKCPTVSAKKCLMAIRSKVSLYPCPDIDKLRWKAQASKYTEGQYVYAMFKDYVKDSGACIKTHGVEIVSDLLGAISWLLEKHNERHQKKCEVCRQVDALDGLGCFESPYKSNDRKKLVH